MEASGEEGDQGQGDVCSGQQGGTRGCEEVMGEIQQPQSCQIQIKQEEDGGNCSAESQCNLPQRGLYALEALLYFFWEEH